MKHYIKTALAALMTAVMMFALAGCGEMDINNLKGDWTLVTLDEKSVEERAKELGKDAYLYNMNLTISDKEAVLSGYEGSRTYSIVLKSDGFEGYLRGVLAFGAQYDGGDESIRLEAIIDGDTCKCVFKKGTTELKGPDKS